MVESLDANHEKESFIGLSTIELAKRLVSKNGDIQTLYLRPYSRPRQGEEVQLPVPRERFLNLDLTELHQWATRLGEGYNIALDSNVDLANGSPMHFAMLDLSIPQSDDNLQKTKAKFRELILPKFGEGFFLNSGASYHFLGERLLQLDEWQAFMGSALLTAIISMNQEGVNVVEKRVVDDLYIGHSLVRGESGLRLTTNGRKKSLPTVVGYL